MQEDAGATGVSNEWRWSRGCFGGKEGRGVMKVRDSGEMEREISVSVRCRVGVWVR